MASQRIWYARGIVLVGCLLAPALVFSQQQTDPSSTPDASVSAQGDTPAVSGIFQPQANAAGGQGSFFRALNSASVLSGENGPLQWGWFSVRSASFLEYFTSATYQVPGAPTQTQDYSASALSAALVLDHTFGSSRGTRIAVQYTPSLFITDGHVYSNAANQNTGIDTTFQLNPRWDLHVSDRFSYFASQRSFSGPSLNANYMQGTVVQNNFLNGPGSVLYNSAGASLSYLWSPVTTVNFGSSFGYQNASGAKDLAENLSGFYEGGQLMVSHLISATQSVSLSYSGQHASYTNSSSTAGPQSNQWLQDVLISYGQQLGATWHIGFGLGVVSNIGNINQTSLGANAGITKSFHRMDIALGYNRGHQFNGYITSASSDRVDVTHTMRWNQRLTTLTSVAYFRSPGSNASLTQSGKYGTEEMSFGLTRTLSFTCGISYSTQSGDGVYVLSGHRRFATIGLNWSPSLRTQY